MFDWHDYLEFAQRLHRDSLRGAELRSAISRSYYAAFNITRDYLEQRCGITIDDKAGSVHRQVWGHCQKAKDRRLNKVFFKGIDLCDRRGKADYRASFNCSADEVSISLGLASKIIEKIEELEESTRSAAPDGG